MRHHLALFAYLPIVPDLQIQAIDARCGIVNDLAARLLWEATERSVDKQEIPAFKIGSDWRFNLESIDQWRSDAERRGPGAHIS